MESFSGARVSSLTTVRYLSVVLLALALLIPFTASAANDPINAYWTTNGTVNATVVSGNTLYIGGDFTYVGPPTGSWTALNIGAGGYDSSWPKIIGTVYAAIPDGAGGWYLGGDFTHVGSTAVSSIAHINPDKSVDTNFNATADSIVWTLALVGNTLYVGGQFSLLNGQSRAYLGAVDAATGALSAWDPAANNIVYTLVVSDTTLYAGGGFTILGGQPRNRIAAIDTVSGGVTAWDPNANTGSVFTLLVDGAIVYAGGGFTAIGGQARNRLAALSTSTGLATAWNPNVNSANVRCLALSGSTLYVGGGFTSIGGLTRNRIAALDTTTGVPTAWNPDASSPVRALAVEGNTVYIGGTFTTVGGQPRNRFAAFDATTGALSSWDPNASGGVYTLAVQGSQLFIGGAFTSLGGVTRNRLAAIDTSTGQATAWDPNVTGIVIFTPVTVYALALDGATLYVGGYFNSVGGVARNDIAAIDVTTGLATGWDPNITGNFFNHYVRSLAVDDNVVYAGGWFYDVGGTARNNLAALDKSSGLATAWNPNVNGLVLALALDGSALYTGGSFTTVGALSRSNLAQLDTATGLANSWTANANSSVHALALDGSTLFVGGGFTNINGAAQAYLGAVDKNTAQVGAWNPGVDNYVTALAVNGPNLYLGGDFTSINGTARSYLGSVDKSSGAVTGWDPAPDTTITSLAAAGDRLYAGAYRDSFFSPAWPALSAFEFTPPDAAASAAGGIYSTNSLLVTLSCTDHSGSGCANLRYTLDGSPPTRAATIYTAPVAITGNGTLKFFATDNHGIDGPVQSANYVIDNIAPASIASIAGGAFNAPQSVTLSCSDDNSGCAATYYTTNGDTPTAAATPYTGSITIGSNTTLKYLSVDQAGNPEAVQTQNYLIDTIAPVTSPAPGAGTYGSVQSISLFCNDDNSGCAASYFTLDNSVPSLLSTLYTDPFTLYMNTTVRFFSVDALGNREDEQSVFYAINTTPVASNANLSADEDEPLVGQLDATDLQGDSLTYSLVSGPGIGQVTITDAASGAFVYTPDPNRNGPDSFTFKVNDGQLDSNVATVAIAIAAVNDPPQLLRNGANGIITRVGRSLSFSLAAQDVDTGDVHTYSASFASSFTSIAGIGSVVLNGASLEFTPLAAGSDLLTVTVTDSGGLTGSLSFPVSVTSGASPWIDTNGDGLSNSTARGLGLDPTLPSGDSDGDGIPDALEVGASNLPTDTDADGIIDALEVGAAAYDPQALNFAITASTAKNLALPALSDQQLRLSASGLLSAHNNASFGLPLYDMTQIADPDPDYDYPYGILDFTVVASAGAATVTLQLPPDVALPDNLEVRKYGSTGWRTLTDAIIDQDNHSIILPLLDNDDVDLDPRIGFIRDPVALTVPVTSSDVSGNGGSGGGGSLEPLWLLALLGAWRRRACASLSAREECEVE